MRLIMKTILLVATLMVPPGLNAAEDHEVQVGDLISVSLPGEETLREPFEVDRDGRILLPEVGPVSVAGKTENEMRELVTKRLESVYRDLDKLQVYILKRQLLVNVQGYVEKPGEYILPHETSVQMALHSAGGIRSGAQLNMMKLVRNGVQIEFDYKKYLDSGDTGVLPILRSMDTIFVPASPKTGNVETEFDPSKIADAGDAAQDRTSIKVFGEVNSPGSFSYKESQNLVDLLMRAGGVTRYAGVEMIRVITSGEPSLFNLKRYLDSGDESLLPMVEQGAIVFVPRQEEEIKTGESMVYVMGEVAKPGAYESKEGATFMDILANAGGPTRFAESRQIRVIRAGGEVVPFDLTGYTEGTVAGAPPEITAGDAIFVPEKSDMNEKSWLKVAPNRAVRVIGEVVRPGRIEWSDEMTLLDLLAHVGGPSSRADTSNIEIIEIDENGKSRATVFNLDRFIRQGKSDRDLPKIRAGATVRVHDLPQDPSDNKSQWVRQSSDKSIYVFGQVGAPGRYMFTDNMNFLDILSAADGPTDKADIHNIRISHRNGSQSRVSKLNLSLYFETGDDNLLPKVKTGDTIYIPEKNRNWLDESKESTVRVLGAVNKPGRYRFNDSMTILDLLAEAGGPTQDAYIKKITVVNLSCCKDQARSFDLKKLSKTANFNELPVLRAGDTVYVPDKSESTGGKIREGLSDVFKVVSMAALLGLL